MTTYHDDHVTCFCHLSFWEKPSLYMRKWLSMYIYTNISCCNKIRRVSSIMLTTRLLPGSWWLLWTTLPGAFALIQWPPVTWRDQRGQRIGKGGRIRRFWVPRWQRISTPFHKNGFSRKSEADSLQQPRFPQKRFARLADVQRLDSWGQHHDDFQSGKHLWEPLVWLGPGTQLKQLQQG